MRVFIVHGWGDNPNANWYKWLKAGLEERGHEAFVPEMPNTNAPEMDSWVDMLSKSVGKADAQTCFVGHSIGCQTIMRYVSQLPEDSKIGGMVFVAGWIKLENLAENEKETAKPWLTTPIDFPKIRQATKNIKVFISDNDPYACQEENAGIFGDELGADVEIETGKGHFMAGDGIIEMPEILNTIDKFQNK